MPSGTTFALFALATFLLTVSPGPGVLYVTARTVSQGRAAGFASMFGIESGALARVYGQGFVAQILNPKVAVFAVAFLPQFLNPGIAIAPQVIALGAVYVAIAVMVDLSYVLAASAMAPRLLRGVEARRRSAPISAATYVALGVAAAASGVRH